MEKPNISGSNTIEELEWIKTTLLNKASANINHMRNGVKTHDQWLKAEDLAEDINYYMGKVVEKIESLTNN